MRVVDFTRPLGPLTPVVPGDPPVEFSNAATHEADGYQVTKICLGSHSGTHIDAPRHLFPDGAALSEFPPERFVGNALIVDARPLPEGLVAHDGADDACPFMNARRLDRVLQSFPAGARERVLIWTDGNTKISFEAAGVLVRHRPILVGIDRPSVDATESNLLIHRLLLGAGILVVENLCRLGEMGAGPLQCAILPLALEATDGAPARAVGWRDDSER
jgi:arylformamidase